MTRAELEHAIRAACDVSGEDEVVVFGSQAILGQHPNAPGELRQSMEADIAPASNDPASADRIDANLGEGSLFHVTHGFYVYGLTIEAATLPKGWERRTIELRNPNTFGKAGRCVEAHDLAASKLVAFREKDRAFVRTLIAERLVRVNKLRLRISQLESPQVPHDRLLRWLDLTCSDLYGGGTGG